MWTRKDLAEFKQAIKAEGGDAVLKVGHGETVTVRALRGNGGRCGVRLGQEGSPGT